MLICLLEDPEALLREVADRVGITERAVLRILADLEDSGAISRSKEGRRNRYTVNLDIPLRHPVENGKTAGQLLAFMQSK